MTQHSITGSRPQTHQRGLTVTVRPTNGSEAVSKSGEAQKRIVCFLVSQTTALYCNPREPSPHHLCCLLVLRDYKVSILTMDIDLTGKEFTDDPLIVLHRPDLHKLQTTTPTTRS